MAAHLPEITIITPVFNRQEKCERALRSVLAQNAANAEIIVVDDASSPPFQLRGDLARSNIRVIYHQRNLGAAGARNTGIAAASSDWLLFLDSDDTWPPDTLAPRLAMAKEAYAASPSDLTAYVAGFVLEDPRSGRRDTRIPRASDNPLDFASGCWFSPGSTLLVRRAAFATVGPYDIELSRLEDLDWFLRLALAGGKIERWPHSAAMIELGTKPSRAALEQAANRLLAKYAVDGPVSLTPALIDRLKAYLDVERASNGVANRSWLTTLFYLTRSWVRVPRTTLHLERFWD